MEPFPIHIRAYGAQFVKAKRVVAVARAPGPAKPVPVVAACVLQALARSKGSTARPQDDE